MVKNDDYFASKTKKCGHEIFLVASFLTIARHGFSSRFFSQYQGINEKKVQIGVKFGDFFSHENQIMPSIGWLIYFGTPLILHDQPA